MQQHCDVGSLKIRLHKFYQVEIPLTDSFYYYMQLMNDRCDQICLKAICNKSTGGFFHIEQWRMENKHFLVIIFIVAYHNIL